MLSVVLQRGRWVLLALVVAVLSIPSAARAQAAPPPSKVRQVLTKIHTDAVSVGPELALGTKADIGDEREKDLDPALTVFNVEQAAKRAVPEDARYAFLGAPGADVWIAPQSNPEGALLWPGFSTEDVPAGTFERDEITLSVEKRSGPGTFDLYSVDGFGAITRLLTDRGDAHRAWTIKAQQHIHANWAFSAAGTYILRFTATAKRGGAPITASMDYRFQVGFLPDPVRTTTTHSVDKTESSVGDPVTFSARVEPVGATGWVEFRTPYALLGFAPVGPTGTATFTTTGLELGTSRVRARFVPEWGDDFTATVSEYEVSTVREAPAGPRLRIDGGKASYASGETLALTASGLEPADGQRIRWRYATGAGEDAAIYQHPNFTEQPGAQYTQLVSRKLDGLQLVAELVEGARVLKRSERLTVHVSGEPVGSGVPVRIEGARASYAAGEYADLRPAGDPLPEGHAYRLVLLSQFGAPNVIPRSRFLAQSYDGQEVAFQQLDAEGRVVGQSPPVLITAISYAVAVVTSKPVYKPGDVAEFRAEVTPNDGRFTRFTWFYSSDTEFTQLEETSGVLRRTVTASDDGAAIIALLLNDEGNGFAISQNAYINVEAPLGDRAFILKELAGHYHSGETVTLETIAETLPENPAYRWFLKRADQTEFAQLPITAARHTLRASQALDGALVHAQLLDAGGTVLATTPDRTIHVSDHGDPPNEVLTVRGLAERYAPGETIALTAEQAPETPLDHYEWWVQRKDATTPTQVAGATGPVLTLSAEARLDGATVFARLTRDTGVPYITSAPVTLHVSGQRVTLGGRVEQVLALELGAAPDLGAFVPGTARDYAGTLDATVTTTVPGTQLLVSDPGANPGHLVNGSAVLSTPLHLGSAPLTAPVTVRTFARGVSLEPVAITFKQAIAAREPLEVGSYAKTLTFSLVTTTP
ncbi:choice-of-anchor M domain-containing protein [Solirubrobacter phytolaccae]|uniref:Choice-of-anchor M domain-containing protein n=1 Tax=Solirubrobacter phytolaccae TaxID=1404360 RepID=A0A9X3S8N8_9ACTN|nr:choice-of-anchor M domain-containing protein [Solirubrobacter phytolaccae]MDA0180531.1 choice-of-anchor M domain-containing protein [Solirubrobacter phytolaccae]